MRHLLLGVSAVAIGTMWAGSAYMNYNAVWTYGISPTDAQFYSVLSVAGDVIKAMAASMVLYALCKKKWLAGALAMVFLAGTVIWSANSAVRYASANIIGKFQEARVNETLTMAKLQKLEMEKQQIEWLQKQTVSKYHKERKRMTTEINDARRSFDETIKALENSDKTTLEADPHYSLLSDIFGISEGDAAKGVALFFAILIEAIAGFGWFVLFSIYAPEPKPKKREATPQKNEGCMIDKGTPVHTPGPSNVVSLPTPETAKGTEKKQFNQWFSDNVVIVTHPALKACVVYKMYKEAGGAMSQRTFGQTLRKRLPKAKVHRKKDGYYYYIAIKDQAATAMAA